MSKTATDPFQVDAYVHDGTMLYRIVERDGNSVWLEHCSNYYQHEMPVKELHEGGWEIALPAPKEDR